MAKKMTFEQAIEKLEAIVSDMEEGRIGLEQSIEKYAEGVTLIKHCRAVLDSAEKKIKLLTSGDDGELAVDGELPEMDEADEDSDES